MYEKELEEMYKQKLDIKAKKFETNYKKRNNIHKKINSKILQILKKDWKDVKFHMITINNNYIDEAYDILKCEDKIEVFRNRISCITEHKPLKFYYAC
jgi:hypothetical protein